MLAAPIAGELRNKPSPTVQSLEFPGHKPGAELPPAEQHAEQIERKWNQYNFTFPDVVKACQHRFQCELLARPPLALRLIRSMQIIAPTAATIAIV